MRAPAEFVVLRHLITHPDDEPYTLAKHTGLRVDSVAKVVKRLGPENRHSQEQLLARLRAVPRRPNRRSIHFQAPNPLTWLKQFKEPYLVSGQVAAAEAEKINLVPSSVLAFVPLEHVDAAVQAALDIFASLAPAKGANLHIRVADPWLTNDDADARLAELGQRLLDYDEDPLIQMAWRLTRRA